MSEKKRILLVSHSNHLGGAELCFLELLKVLRINSDYELFVLLPAVDGKLKSLCELLCDTIYMQYLPQWIDEGNTFSFKKKINCIFNIASSVRKSLNLTKSIQPDIIITNTSVIPQYGIAAKIKKKKHIWFIHELVDEDFGCQFLYGKAFSKKIISFCSDLVITNSKFVDLRYVSYVEEEKRKMLYQPASIKPIEDSTDLKNNNNKETLTLLIIGKVIEFKGQKEAISAVNELLNRNVDVELLVLGEGGGTYSEELKTFVADNNIADKVNFIPFTNNPVTYYQQSDIVLVCSRCEALGRITIEAMKMGLPIVASNRGGNLELIRDGFNGYLYEYGNPNDLADKVLLLNNEEVRRKMGMNGKEWAEENFNEEKFSKQFNNLLNSL